MTEETRDRDLDAALRRWNQGDSGALNDLMSSATPTLERIARSASWPVNDPLLAPAELINEFFIHMAENQLRFQDSRQFLSSANRFMLDRTLRERRVRTRETQLDAGWVDPSASNVLELIDASDTIVRALVRLDQSLREVAVLRGLEGLSFEEIADVLAQPGQEVRQTWEIALRRMREDILQERGVQGQESTGEELTTSDAIIKPASSLVTLSLVDPALIRAIQADPWLLQTLDFRLFEKLLADLLSRMGYEIELQRGTKDGGVDIFAVKRIDPLGPHKYLLQAKRWRHAVGVEPVRELLFLHSHHRATKSCLATTSRFTAGAWQLANDYRWQLELKDFEKLQEWIYRSLA